MTPDQIITTHYGKLTSAQIAKVIGDGWNDARVRVRAQRLGIAKTIGPRTGVFIPSNGMTDTELQTVRQHWDAHSIAAIALMVKRRCATVRAAAKRLGLPSKQLEREPVVPVDVRAMRAERRESGLVAVPPRPSGQKITKLPQLQQPPVMDFTDAADLDVEERPRARPVPLPPITPERIHARHQIEAVHEMRRLAPDELRCICGRPGAVHCHEHRQLLQREGVL